MPTFGEKFRKVLRDHNLTQAAAAKLLGTTQSVISYYSNLDRQPRRGTLLHIAERLDVSPAELAGEQGSEQHQKSSVSKGESAWDRYGEPRHLRAMKNLKKRWKKNPRERDVIRHLIALLFHADATQVIAWLDES